MIWLFQLPPMSQGPCAPHYEMRQCATRTYQIRYQTLVPQVSTDSFPTHLEAV